MNNMHMRWPDPNTDELLESTFYMEWAMSALYGTLEAPPTCATDSLNGDVCLTD